MSGARLSQMCGWRGPGSILAPPRPRSSRAPTVTRRPAAARGEASGEFAWHVFKGVAASFGTIHNDEPMLFERGCFSKSLASKAPKSLWILHDHELVVATTADELQFREDGDALTFLCPVPDTPIAAKAAAYIRSGKLPEVSVGCTIQHEERRTIGGRSVRVIKEASLSEISLVPKGAVYGTDVRLVDLRNDADVRLEQMAERLDRTVIKARRFTTC